MHTGHRLLILSCSQRKRPENEPLPAVERYDGPAFRVLRRFLSHPPPSSMPLDCYILSAEFGLISAHQAVPNYDCRMTPQRAQELRPCVIADIADLLSATSYQELCLCMGLDYLSIFEEYRPPSPLTLTKAVGGTGRRLSLLHDWLHGAPPVLPALSSLCTAQGRASLRGVAIEQTPEQIFAQVRQALAKEPLSPAHALASWYVLVDGQRVAPKWIVSQLTGLPVRSFHTDDARRVLIQLGVEVYRA